MKKKKENPARFSIFNVFYFETAVNKNIHRKLCG